MAGVLNNQAIKAFATVRQVPHLLHFTQAANLSTILAHGIYPVARAHEVGVDPLINDALRLDLRRDASSVSIGFPNEKMFFKYRSTNASADWVVLVLHPSILWSKNCAFCPQNAAKKDIRLQTIEQRSSPEAFLAMFGDVVGGYSRREQTLKLSDPTDVQAEVLVIDVIEPHFIVGLIFSSAAVRTHYLPPLSGLQTRIHNGEKSMFVTRQRARTAGY